MCGEDVGHPIRHPAQAIQGEQRVLDDLPGGILIDVGGARKCETAGGVRGENRRDGGRDGPPAGAAPAAPAAPDPTPRSVPGSNRRFTLAETRDAFNPPDWHPAGHPPMPPAVANGRRSEMRACGFCHLTNGQGRPENASLAGLPAAYIIQQMADFKSGARRSSEPRMGPPNAMIADAKAATDAEVREAAEYFAAVPYRPWIRVVERADVPRTRIAGWMHVPTEGAEPIGARIIEMPEDLPRTELRDGASGFVAYVPPGSISRGERLVTTGGGRTVACGTCHVYVDPDWFARLVPAREDEEAMLDQLLHARPNSRLSCQVLWEAALDGLRLTLAPTEG